MEAAVNGKVQAVKGLMKMSDEANVSSVSPSSIALTLETSAASLFAVANLRYQLSWYTKLPSFWVA